MAEFGAKYPCFKPKGAVTGVVIGKLVTANLTVNLASGELFADDELAEQVSEFASGSLAMETDDMVDASAKAIYGCTVTGGEVIYNKEDDPPEGELAYYKTLMRRGKKYYKGFYYPSARASIGNDNGQTRGSSITFQTSNTTFIVKCDANGDWRKTKVFDSEADAIAYVNTKCTITGA